MSRKSITFLSLIFFVVLPLTIQCKDGKKTDIENTQNDTRTNASLTSKDIKSIKYTEYALSDQSLKLLDKWPKFIILQDEIEKLKNNNMSFFTDDKAILNSFITDLTNEIPSEINSSTLLVRLSVLKTCLLKMEESLKLQDILKKQHLAIIEDMLVANTNLIFQINKTLEKKNQNVIKP